jgi:hypothetical protein
MPFPPVVVPPVGSERWSCLGYLLQVRMRLRADVCWVSHTGDAYELDVTALSPFFYREMLNIDVSIRVHHADGSLIILTDCCRPQTSS